MYIRLHEYTYTYLYICICTCGVGARRVLMWPRWMLSPWGALGTGRYRVGSNGCSTHGTLLGTGFLASGRKLKSAQNYTGGSAPQSNYMGTYCMPFWVDVTGLQQSYQNEEAELSTSLLYGILQESGLQYRPNHKDTHKQYPQFMETDICSYSSIRQQIM